MLPPYYLPNVHWWAQAVHQGGVEVGTGLNYEKQTLLSRSLIYTANGVQQLVVPVTHASRHQPVQAATIDYRQRWQQVHTRALQSAYGRCAFWPYYGPDLVTAISQPHDTLPALNLALIHLMAGWLQLPVKVTMFAPQQVQDVELAPYYQPWSGWQPGLSVVDMLLNCGPESRGQLIHARLNP